MCHLSQVCELPFGYDWSFPQVVDTDVMRRCGHGGLQIIVIADGTPGHSDRKLHPTHPRSLDGCKHKKWSQWGLNTSSPSSSAVSKIILRCVLAGFPTFTAWDCGSIFILCQTVALKLTYRFMTMHVPYMVSSDISWPFTCSEHVVLDCAVVETPQLIIYHVPCLLPSPPCLKHMDYLKYYKYC